MLLFLDGKLIFAVVAFLGAVFAYIPYYRDILAGKTKPHAYTWLIWSITNGTAAFGILAGGGGYGAGAQLAGVTLTLITFFFSLRYGTKNITKSDTGVLILALGAIFFWWLFNSPLYGVLMATTIDALGYLPTFRKSFEEPWSESLSSWVLFTLVALLTILALNTYSLLTMVYLLMSATANFILLFICILRRRLVPKPL